MVWALGWRRLKVYLGFLLLELSKYGINFIILSSSLSQSNYCSQPWQLSANENIPLVYLFTQQTQPRNTKWRPLLVTIFACRWRDGSISAKSWWIWPNNNQKVVKNPTQPTHRFTTIIGEKILLLPTIMDFTAESAKIPLWSQYYPDLPVHSPVRRRGTWLHAILFIRNHSILGLCNWFSSSQCWEPDNNMLLHQDLFPTQIA